MDSKTGCISIAIDRGMNKPNNPKCDTCFVTENVLRCWNCKYKTKEWENKNIRRIMMRGEKDLYKPKAQSEVTLNER